MKNENLYRCPSQTAFCRFVGYAEHEEVIIKREDGAVFLLSSQRRKSSPFDIDGVDVSVEEITKELAFKRMVERGLQDSLNDRVISQEQLEKQIASW